VTACCKSELGYVVHCFMTKAEAEASRIAKRKGAKIVTRYGDGIRLTPTKTRRHRSGVCHLGWGAPKKGPR
jgi:hypothetical protein